jgi:hypothetical protein
VNNYHVAYPIAIALACAIAFGVTLSAIALIQALIRAPDLVDPATDQAEQVVANPVGPGQFAPDLAWPYYPFRQSRADLRRARGNVASNNDAIWRPGRAFFEGHGRHWWFLFPIPVAVIAFLAAVSAVSWFCYLVYALVAIASTGASLALLVPAAATLRAAERWRRRRLRTQAACMRCFHVTQWPAYQCPTCGRPQYDVRPGRLGLLIRRCECGTHLPTMALRAAWQLTPLCVRCGAPLASGAGAARDIRIPVFGDVSAGKTRFLYASFNSLMLTARQARLDVSFPDQYSRDLANFGLGVIRTGKDTAKTSTNARVALSWRLGAGRQSELVHMYDAAGENFRDARRPDALRFLEDGHGLVYVLDPFSIPDIRKRFAGHSAWAIRQAHAAAGDPEITYDEVASRLRDGGIPVRAQRLAVIVSKADLLRAAGLHLPVGSDAISLWLSDIGVHNLVLSTRHEFAEVRFFTVASQLVRRDGCDDPGKPLRWLLTGYGVRLPADPAEPPVPTGRPVRSQPAEAWS